MADDPLDKNHYLRRISEHEAIDGTGKHYVISEKDDNVGGSLILNVLLGIVLLLVLI